MNQFDVIVIGGGPAGLAVATLLAKSKLTVGVLDRSIVDSLNRAETLSARLAPLLLQLGVEWDFNTAVRSPGVVSAWESANPTNADFIFDPTGGVFHVLRSEFDAMLRRHASMSGADVILKINVQSFTRRRSDWKICTNRGCFFATWIVDATGKSARIVRHFSRVYTLDYQVAVYAQLEEVPGNDGRMVVESVQDGWCYFTPLPNKKGFAVWLTDLDILQVAANTYITGTFHSRLTELWQEKIIGNTIHVSSRIKGSSVNRVKMIRAGVVLCETPIGEGWLGVGDSILGHDPLSGSGITHALESAHHAAICLKKVLNERTHSGTSYSQWHTSYSSRYLHERKMSYGSVVRFHDSKYWHRRHADDFY